MPTESPRLPLPPPITSDEPGTWAYDTMSRRVRSDILSRIFRENSLDERATTKLKALDEELANAKDTPLSLVESDGGPDVKTWNEQILIPVLNERQTWLSATWATAEFYLYRRIMSAIDYFNTKIDPFILQKELGLTSAIDSIDILANRVNTFCEAAPSASFEQKLNQFQTLVLTSLWGNRMDLSIWPVGGGNASNEATKQQTTSKRSEEAFSSVLEVGQKMILSNDIEALSEYVNSISNEPVIRMDIIVDNAGFELFCDLCLADFLVTANLATIVYIHLKAHPTFVSDAMEKDLLHTIDFLQQNKAENGSPTSHSKLGGRWASHVNSGKWILKEDYFWVQPLPMWEMPREIYEELNSKSSLVFVKGDANYRRLLGDLKWEYDESFNDIVSYFPSPLCALRTLKAELGCGIPKETSERLSMEEGNKWLVNGKYGVIQFCNTRN